MLNRLPVDVFLYVLPFLGSFEDLLQLTSISSTWNRWIYTAHLSLSNRDVLNIMSVWKFWKMYHVLIRNRHLSLRHFEQFDVGLTRIEQVSYLMEDMKDQLIQWKGLRMFLYHSSILKEWNAFLMRLLPLNTLTHVSVQCRFYTWNPHFLYYLGQISQLTKVTDFSLDLGCQLHHHSTDAIHDLIMNLLYEWRNQLRHGTFQHVHIHGFSHWHSFDVIMETITCRHMSFLQSTTLVPVRFLNLSVLNLYDCYIHSYLGFFTQMAHGMPHLVQLMVVHCFLIDNHPRFESNLPHIICLNELRMVNWNDNYDLQAELDDNTVNIYDSKDAVLCFISQYQVSSFS